MSRRTSIVKALAKQVNEQLDGSAPYNFNLYNAAHPELKFWDEVHTFPSVYIAPGPETREYLPGGFIWGFLSVNVNIYVKSENPNTDLEEMLGLVEKVINDSRNLVYAPGKPTVEISISSIVTDEGLLSPYGVAQIALEIRYQVSN